MKLLFVFILLNILNVIIQTVKSLCTVKCGKSIAAFVNALAYGLYTIVIVYMMCDLPLWEKATIVALCNLVGVYIVKLIEEKARKDKLWKVEATVKAYDGESLKEHAKLLNFSFNYIDVGKYWVFNFYCPTQKSSAEVKSLLAIYQAKYFASETKNL